MQARPALNEGATLRSGLLHGHRHQPVVSRHDGDEGVGPVGDEQCRAQQPTPIIALPPSDQAKQAAGDRERCLHGEAAFVCWLPFGEQSTIVKDETRRLFGDIDVDRRAEEHCGDDQGELSGDHVYQPEKTRSRSRPRDYAADLSRLRLMISSAICTVLSAAPLRKLSDTTQKERPLSRVWSSRMRLT